MKAVVPTLVVADMAKSIDFYKAALGFELKFSMAGPDGNLAHASIKNGDVEFMMGPAGFSDNIAPGPVGNGVSLYLLLNENDDVDALFEQAKAAGANVLMEPRDEFWGDRIWSITDLDGYSLVVSKHVRDVSTEEMEEAAKAYAPAD